MMLLPPPQQTLILTLLHAAAAACVFFFVAMVLVVNTEDRDLRRVSCVVARVVCWCGLDLLSGEYCKE